MTRHKIRRQTCRCIYEHICTRSSVQHHASYDTWTDCRPTSRRKCSSLTCKVLSSISCRHRHCYNTQQSNITGVYYRPMNFKTLNWSWWNKVLFKMTQTLHDFFGRSFVWLLSLNNRRSLNDNKMHHTVTLCNHCVKLWVVFIIGRETSTLCLGKPNKFN